MPQPRAAILARVSSDSQDVASQLADMRGRVARDGCTLDERFVYVDDGVSGRTGNLAARADLLRMMVDLSRDPRPWDRLYFFEYDRLARSEDIEEQGRILGPLQRAGVDLVTRNGLQPALSTALGRIWAHWQLEAAAEWLSKHKAQIKRGKDAAIAAGKKPAGPTPYGLRYERAGGRWSLDESAAEVVREVFARVAAAESCDAIARDLNAREVPRPRSGRWLRERVWGMVRSRTYVGEWTADKRRKLVVAVPPIVDEATWQAAQDALLAQGRHRGPRSRRGSLLEGLCRCGICGSPIVIHSGGRVGNGYYVCKSRLGGGKGAGCGLAWRKTAEVDAAAWAAVAELLAKPERLGDVLELQQAGGRDDSRSFAVEVASYEHQLRKLDARHAELAARFAEGELEPAVFDVAMRKGREKRALLDKSLRDARTELTRAENAAAHAGALIQSLTALHHVWQHAEGDERREAMRLLVPRPRSLVLGPGGLTGDLWVQQPDQAADPMCQAFAAGCSSERLAHGARVALRVAL